MRKRGWEESTKSPDWTDNESMMRAMGSLHSGHVEVQVSPVGTGFGTGVQVEARMCFEVLPGSALPAVVKVVKPYPSNGHATMAACVFSLLYELDFEIGKVYKQESLWK